MLVQRQGADAECRGPLVGVEAVRLVERLRAQRQCADRLRLAVELIHPLRAKRECVDLRRRRRAHFDPRVRLRDGDCDCGDHEAENGGLENPAARHGSHSLSLTLKQTW